MQLSRITPHNIWWRARWVNQFLIRGQLPKLKAPFWFRTEMGLFKCPDVYGPMQFEKNWEIETGKTVSKLRNSLFVDVGANLGFYTVLAANNGNQVIAVEANPRVYSCLMDTVYANGLQDRVTVINAAAWSANGRIPFHSVDDTSLSHVDGYSTVEGRLTVTTSDIRSITLDSIIHVKPGLVKLDIEHAEPEALKGAKMLIDWKTPMIFEAINKEHLEECKRLIGREVVWLGKEGAGVNYYAP